MKESDKDKCYRWRQIQALSAICHTISNDRPDGVFPVETLCIVKEIRPNEVRYKYTGYGEIVKDFEACRILAEHVDKRWFYRAKVPDIVNHTDLETNKVPKEEKADKPKKKRGRPAKDRLNNKRVEKENVCVIVPELDKTNDIDIEPVENNETINNSIDLNISQENNTVENDYRITDAWNVLTNEQEWTNIKLDEQQVQVNNAEENVDSDNTVNFMDNESYQVNNNSDPVLELENSLNVDVKTESEINGCKIKSDEKVKIIIKRGRGRPRTKINMPVKRKNTKKKRKRKRKEQKLYSDTQQNIQSDDDDDEVLNKVQELSENIKAESSNDEDNSELKSEDDDLDEDYTTKVDETAQRQIKRRRRLKPSEHPSDKCPLCNRLIPVVNFSTHLHMHEVKRKRNANMKYCNNCHKFVEGSVYAAHKARHVEENSIGVKCEKCNEVVRRVRYKYHFMRCVGKPPYFCFPCGKSYDRADRYILHHKSLHGWDPCEAYDRMFRASPAGQKFLEERVKAVTRKAIETLTEAPIVDLENIQNDEDVDDTLKKDVLLYPQTPKQQEFLCNKCGAKRTSRASLQEHMVSHIDSRDYRCQDCDKTFKTLKALNVHVKYTLMHGNTPKRMCKYCGKCFVLQSQLSTHERRMHEEANLKIPLPKTACGVCGKMVLKRNIAVHLKTHSEDRPYECTQCNMRFKFTDILKRHMILHTGTRNFHCELCGKSFAQSATLYKHKLTHREKQSLSSTSTTTMVSVSHSVVPLEHGNIALHAPLLQHQQHQIVTPLPNPVQLTQTQQQQQTSSENVTISMQMPLSSSGVPQPIQCVPTHTFPASYPNIPISVQSSIVNNIPPSMW